MIDEIKDQIKEKALNIIHTDNYTSSDINGGFYVKLFEEELTKYVGRETIVLNSGTSALISALYLAGVQHGDEVIVPAFTFKATWNAVRTIGAVPVPVDIKLDDYTIDPDKIKITNKTTAIIAVDLYGNVADIKQIRENLKADGKITPVIEDACQALGSNDGQNRCGSLADYGCFSFYPSKIINTMEGGAIVVNNSIDAKGARQLRNHGGVDKNGDAVWGLNFRMPEMNAMMGQIQMIYIDNTIERRKKKELELYNRYKTYHGVSVQKPRFNTNGQLFTMRINNRDEFMAITPTARIYYDYTLGNCPNAINASEHVVSFQTN